jgi:hypothetical protein
MKRKLISTERGYNRLVAAQNARYQATKAISQEVVDAELGDCEKYLKEHGDRRYYVYWEKGSKEAKVSREWRI